jgi:hypothetical protein
MISHNPDTLFNLSSTDQQTKQRVSSAGRTSLGQRKRRRVRPVQNAVGDHLVHRLRRVRPVPRAVRGWIVADGAPRFAARHGLVTAAGEQSVRDSCRDDSTGSVTVPAVLVNRPALDANLACAASDTAHVDVSNFFFIFYLSKFLQYTLIFIN